MFIDSWVWLEYFLKGSKRERAEKIIEKLILENGVISTLVLTEVRYQLIKKVDLHTANQFLQIIYSFDNLSILPVTSTVAIFAADLKAKYYSTKNKFSYGDAIHLATAILSNCDIFSTGDPDFSEIKEIKVEII